MRAKRCILSKSIKKPFNDKNTIQIKVDADDSRIGPFVIEKEIGKGAFSTVLKLKRPDITKRSFACKVFQKSDLDADKEARISFEREVCVNHQLHHPGHAELIDLICDDNNYYMIMEYCSGGSLQKYISKHQGPLEESEAKPLFKQLIETLSYIQKMGVSHRDIKPDNILFNRSHKLVLIDYGFSRFVERNERKNLVRSRCGSTEYASPEVLSNSKDPYDGFASDIWSCGVILYYMVSQTLPWDPSLSTSETIEQIRSGKYDIPPKISEPLKDLLQKILTLSPEKRITVTEILGHAWLKDVPTQFDLGKETIYNAISLKMVDTFLGYDDCEYQSNSKQIKRINSTRNTSFKHLQVSLIKSYNASEPIQKVSSHRPRRRLERGDSIPQSSYYIANSDYAASGNRRPLNKLQSTQSIRPLIKENKKHIIRPPGSNRPKAGPRGKYHEKLIPLKPPKEPVEFKPQIPSAPMPSARAPRHCKRPV